jgi:hypothetical protein
MTATQPFTASAFLFGADQDTGYALAEALDEQGVLGATDLGLRLVTQTARRAAEDQIAVVAGGLLDLDLGDLVVAGWRKHGELAAAAEHTAANPGTSEVVKLATHRISSVHRPYVELLLNGTHLANVNFELEVEFVVTALVATVRDGQVVSLGSGECDVAATVAAEGFRLASHHQHLELPLVVRWPVPLRLGGGPAQPPYGPTASPAPAPPRRPSPPRWHRGLRSHGGHRSRRPRTAGGTAAD